MNLPSQSILNSVDQIIFHFDGNNNDADDISALPMSAAIAKSAEIQSKTTFFYGNNISEPNVDRQVADMRKGAAFAERLGIDTYSYQDGIEQTTNELVSILNSGRKILAIEGGPMEAIYRALERTSADNRKNLTLVSHSSWNEDRDVGSRPGGGKPRTWSDIRSNFSEVTQIDIKDQNGLSPTGANLADAGFNSTGWNWLDSTDNPVLQEARTNMRNATGIAINDPSDAGMLFYALNGQQDADPFDAKAFFDENPPTFADQPPATASDFELVDSPAFEIEESPIYIGKYGDVILEAEGASLQGDWKRTQVQGREAVLYDGFNSFGEVLSGQALTYNFETDESGQYGIALHSARDNSVMDELRDDLGNDAFIAVEEIATGKVIQAPTKLFTYFGSANNELRWGNTFDRDGAKSPSQVSLEADTQYRLIVSGRSDGYVVDRITLSNGGFYQDADVPVSDTKTSEPASVPVPAAAFAPVPEPASVPMPAPTPNQALINFALVDANTDQVIAGYESLDANSTIDLNGLELDNFNILARINADSPEASSVESLKFESSLGDRTENVAPYALFGDIEGDFFGAPLTANQFTLKATAYTQANGQGEAIGSASLSDETADSLLGPEVLSAGVLGQGSTQASAASFDVNRSSDAMTIGASSQSADLLADSLGQPNDSIAIATSQNSFENAPEPNVFF